MVRAASLAAARLKFPGVAIAAGVAVASFFLAPLLKSATGGRVALPDMVIALIIGIMANGIASRPQFEPGLTWCVKKLLRYAIALLGLRVALGDIAGLGWAVVVLVILAMALTLFSGIALARALGREDGFGALAGAATAVCGASATLATATVVPDYRDKKADVAFTVVMANAVSTLVMLAYPPLCLWLGLDARQSGIMLGATIHDMAQVVGAGYAVSDAVGNSSVIVKLFRVFLLLPVVLAIGWWFAARGAESGTAKVPMPVFALVFLVLCLVNSAMAAAPDFSAAVYFPQIKAMLGEISKWALLIAIAALGLGTSLGSIMRIGWRHLAVFAGTTLVILLGVVFGLMLIG
ncbi:MAG: YeiH family protein [Beijerinckiaceae bacterium]